METINQVFEKHIGVSQNDITLIDLLAHNCPQISRQKLKQVMKYGAVWVTEKKTKSKTIRIRRAKKILSEGDEVHLYYDQNILFSEITPAQLK